MMGVSNHTAVCVSGQLRSFLYAPLQNLMYKNFHHAGYDYFLSTDEQLSAVQTNQLMLSPLRSMYVDNGGSRLDGDHWGSGNEHGLLKCPNNTVTHPYLFPQAVRFVACHQLIRREEARRGYLYTWIARTRTDLLFHVRLPPPLGLLQPGGTGGPWDIVLFDDLLGVATRERMPALLLTPALVYRECHGVESWTRACGTTVRAKQLTSGAPPCSTMNLVLVHEPGPVALRQCGFLWQTRCGDLLPIGSRSNCLASVHRPASSRTHGQCPSNLAHSMRAGIYNWTQVQPDLPAVVAA